MYLYKINRKVKTLLGINTNRKRLFEIETKRIDVDSDDHDSYLFLRSKKKQQKQNHFTKLY